MPLDVSEGRPCLQNLDASSQKGSEDLLLLVVGAETLKEGWLPSFLEFKLVIPLSETGLIPS